MSTAIYVWPHVVQGEVIGEIRRFPPGKKGGKKSDIPFYNKLSSGEFGKGGPKQKPYPLIGVDSVKLVTERVVICEGQKKQQSWETLGWQTVASLFGASSAHTADWTSLSAVRQFLYAPDKGSAGEHYASCVYRILAEQNPDAEHRVIRLPDISDKGGLDDWLKAQPELKNWNGYDPFEANDPTTIVIRNRLAETVQVSLEQIPREWAQAPEWKEPEAFDSSLRPIQRLPTEYIPQAFKAPILDAAERIGCPHEFTAISTIIALGTAIGTACQVQPRRHANWRITPNLWGVIVAPPGSKKSAAINWSLAPIMRLDQEAAATNKEDRLEYEKQKLKYDIKHDQIKTEQKKYKPTDGYEPIDELQSPPEPPAAKRYVLMDATIEAVADKLSENPKGALLYVDELYKLLKTWDNENRGADRPFYLTSWSGSEPYIVDRKTGKQLIRIPKLCISLLGSMQPDTLRKYVVEPDSDLNDGFIQRLQLAIYLDKCDLPKTPRVDKAEDKHGRWQMEQIFKKLTEDNYVAMGAIKDDDSAPYFRFSDEAQEVYEEWLGHLDHWSDKEEDPFLEQHWAKYESLMPTLALIFHLADIASGLAGPSPISSKSVKLAAKWCGFLQRHAERIYSLHTPRSLAAVQELTRRIKSGELSSPFTERQIVKKGWRLLNNAEAVKKVCDELQEAHWIRRVVKHAGPQGGRVSKEYLVNPRIYETEE